MHGCSPDRPWGIHLPVRNDESCGRCGWTAPGPRSDAVADTAVGAVEVAAARGWRLIDGQSGERLAA